MDLSKTLNELKDKISESKLGPIEKNHQRLFHLGRELKSGGRSLSALGIGRYHNFTLHLHSTQPTPYELSSDEENEQILVEDDVIEVTDSRKQVIELLDDEDSDDDVDVVDGPTVKRQRV